MKKAVLILAVLMLVSAGLAHEADESTAPHVDQAIIATDFASVDAAVASAAGEQSGSPVIIAEDGDVSDSAIDVLQQAGVASVIIVGGPAVVRAEAEEKLKSRGFSVIRLWGLERTGTALEVARHFWHGGASCAVLVEDTKDAAADTTIQTESAALAIQDRCALVPIPAGKIPADVIQLLSELGVSRVRVIILQPDAGGIRNDLREYNAEIITGKAAVETKLKAEIPVKARQEGVKPKLVIVAAPSWQHALSAGATPNERSVVRIVTTVNESLELAGFITSNSITDISIVGEPELASQIDSAFEEKGINATKAVGRRASEIAKLLLLRDRAKWSEKREAARERFSSAEFQARAKEKIAEFLDRAEALISDTELQIIDLKSRLEQSGAERPRVSSAIAELEQRLAEAKASVAEARAKLDSGDLEGAALLRALITSRLRLSSWRHRAQMTEHFTDMLGDEGEGLGDAAAGVAERFAAFRRDMLALKASCHDSAIVERIFLKAHSLREAYAQAVEAGQRKKAAEIIHEARELASIAHRAAQLCIRQSSLGAELKEVLARRQALGAEELAKSAPEAEEIVKAIDERTAEDVSSEVEGSEGEEAPSENAGLVSRVFLCKDATFDICDAEVSGTRITETVDIVAEVSNSDCAGAKAGISCTIVVTNPLGNRTGFIQDRAADCKDKLLCAFSFNKENAPGTYTVSFNVADKVSGKTGTGSITVTVP